MPSEISQRERILGCFLGGAVGDALGAPVEFMRLGEIRRAFGPQGIAAYAPAYGRIGAITDDTQMTLFTAEGLIRADNRARDRGMASVEGVAFRAYLRWLATQGVEPHDRSVHSASPIDPDWRGWLYRQEFLHSQRGPGTTCVSALTAGVMGTFGDPVNDSKGCGTIMRIAPVGFLSGWLDGTDEDPTRKIFDLACRLSALTHGHPSGYYAAGAFAVIIAGMYGGVPIEQAIESAVSTLEQYPNADETANSLRTAVKAARSRHTSPETVESLGEGWVAEEALAISVYCALVAVRGTLNEVEPGSAGQVFDNAVLLAVNHGGDTDSTGALAGQLIGTMLGVRSIDETWLAPLEGRAVITSVAEDMAAHFVDPDTTLRMDDLDVPDDVDRYPPN